MSYTQYAYPDYRIETKKEAATNAPPSISIEQGIPTVLAGPIIKRCEPEAIYIWVCTSVKLNLGIMIFSGRANTETLNITYPPYIDRNPKEDAKGYVEKGINTYNVPSYNKEKGTKDLYVIGEGFAKSSTLGAHIYVTLIKAEPLKGEQFPRGEEISYEIFVLENKNSFANAKLLLDNQERSLITIDSSKKYSPSFCLQKEDISDLRIAFGSCRKFHGNAEDSTVELFQKKYFKKNIKERPNNLFLLGDQIYADDVSKFLISDINFLGSFLFGYKEKIPVSKIDDDSKNGEMEDDGFITPADIQPSDRQEKISRRADFTSTDGTNHLAALSEFCIMYLLAYSGVLWSFIDLKWLNRKDFTEENLLELKNILKANKGSLAMRKILANTPTYMICDDHEITDDWYITNEWKKKVLENPLGAQIVMNGVTAYWFFQWLGNDPGSQEGTVPYTTSDFEQIAIGRVNSTNFDNKNFLEKCSNDLRWNYIAPTTPPTVFLDTRFNRQNTKIQYYKFQKPRFVEPDFKLIPTSDDDFNKLECFTPIFITREQIDYLKDLLTMGAYDYSNGFILSTPCPVFGVSSIEKLLNKIFLASNIVDNRRESFMEYEQESWGYNPYNIDNLVNFFVELYANKTSKDTNEKIPTINILSGDVHYTYFNKVKLDIEEEKVSFNINMYTSSGIKNPPSSHLAVALLTSSQKKEKYHVLRIMLEQNSTNDNNNLYELLIMPEDPEDLIFSDYSYSTNLKKLSVLNDVQLPLKTSVWGSYGLLTGNKCEFVIPQSPE